MHLESHVHDFTCLWGVNWKLKGEKIHVKCVALNCNFWGNYFFNMFGSMSLCIYFSYGNIFFLNLLQSSWPGDPAINSTSCFRLTLLSCCLAISSKVVKLPFAPLQLAVRLPIKYEGDMGHRPLEVCNGSNIESSWPTTSCMSGENWGR